jgi:hypothetical protein
MKIHILASRDFISYYFMYPLLVMQRQLAQEFDCKITFFHGINEKLFDSDALLIDNRFFTPLWKDQAAKAISLLEDFRKKHRHIIWLDVTDSTGATQFQVLPYLDRYFKKQILVDKNLYEKRFYGARIYTDYYKTKFNLPDQKAFETQPLKREDIPKLRVSWNLGVGPYHCSRGVNNLRRFIPYEWQNWFPLPFSVKLHPWTEKPKAIAFRGSDSYNNLALAFQRLEIKKRLIQRDVTTDLVPRNQYWQELLSSQIGISPFGAGEICFRDFEIIQAGGLLFKPDMSHLETWPNLFVAGETYVPFAWDLSDFDRKLNELQQDTVRMRTVATKAQTRYNDSFTQEGKIQFCRHFKEIVFA